MELWEDSRRGLGQVSGGELAEESRETRRCNLSIMELEPEDVFCMRRWELELREGIVGMDSTEVLLRERKAFVSTRGFLPAALSESSGVKEGEGGLSELLAMEPRRLQRSTLIIVV